MLEMAAGMLLMTFVLANNESDFANELLKLDKDGRGLLGTMYCEMLLPATLLSYNTYPVFCSPELPEKLTTLKIKIAAITIERFLPIMSIPNIKAGMVKMYPNCENDKDIKSREKSIVL